ncbi:MAG TPA: hypothetical protein PLD88_00370, partial [Candidatus Berkiella sp.]|nr:hypothetical protein [Candidatus Berkiella sp.]
YLRQKEAINEREQLQKLMEEIVDHTVLNNGFDQAGFQEECAAEWDNAKLQQYLSEITPLFPESYQVQNSKAVCKAN